MVHEEAQPVEMNEAKVANAVRHTLWTAQTENRLIAGLKPAIDTLSEIPEEALFCFIAPAKKEDSASHINEVLLKAFCYENDIYTIEVDSAHKLARLLGLTKQVNCALVLRAVDSKTEEEIFTKAELELIDHCEEHWDEPTQPIVKIPDK